MRFGVLLALLFGSVLSCAPEEVVIWSMPPGAGTGGMVPSSGAAGTPTETGGLGGSAGTTATAGSPSAGSGGSGGSGGSSGSALNAAGSAGEGGATGDCTSNADCQMSWVCAKADCEAATGVCEPRPVFCPPDPLPVCGCDHVTYWNDCVRLQSGALSGTAGECRANAMPCDTGADCGVAGASCARFVPKDGVCDEQSPGVCWVAPTLCEPGVELPRWRECGPLAPDPAPCITTCEAIVDECPVKPVHHDTDCP